MRIDDTYHRPVLPLLFCLVLGLVLGCYFPSRTPGAVLLLAVAAYRLCLRLFRNAPAVYSPLFLFCALGYLAIQPWTAPSFSKGHVAHHTDSQPLQISGIIVEKPVDLGNRWRFILSVETLGGRKAAGKIAVSAWNGDPILGRGDRITFYGRIKSIHNFSNPGGFDYRRHMHFKGIWGTAHIPADRLTVLARGRAAGGLHFFDRARQKVSNLIAQAGDEEARGVLKALVTGDRQDISAEGREAFNRAGVGHLLAISGLHIGIIATVFFAMFRRLLTASRFILWRAWTCKGAAVLSIFPVLFYGFLAGMSPSTQRAVIMAAVFLLSFLLDEQHDPVNTLAIAAALILICHPPALFSISFQLSFAAVFAILYGLAVIRPRLLPPPGKSRIGYHLLSFLAVSGFALLGTLPLVMFYFNRVSLIGFLANLLLIPLVGFGVVPVGLLAAVLLPVSSAGALWLIKGGALLTSSALRLIHFFADLPFAAVPTFTPTLFEILCYYLTLAALINLPHPIPPAASDPPSPGCSAPRSDFRRRTAAFILAAASICILADALYWTHERFWRRELKMTVIDVGQGSASLLELPGGHTMLVDGGGLSDNSTFDMGARIVAPLLWRKKIRTIDTMVLSHANSDHLNGLMYVARNFKVRRIWTNSQPADSLSYRRFIALVKKRGLLRPPYPNLARVHEINGATVSVLYPPSDFLKRSRTDLWRNINNNSLVLKVALGSVSFLLPGDIMAAAERELVAGLKGPLASSVLLAPHHGSRHSSSDSFVAAVQPEAVIFSIGRGNRFRFPHPTVLKKYRQKGSRIFRTDCDGAILITTDGRGLSIRTSR